MRTNPKTKTLSVLSAGVVIIAARTLTADGSATGPVQQPLRPLSAATRA